MPPAKRGRGRPRIKLLAEETSRPEDGPATMEEEEQPAAKANVRPRGRPAMKKAIASAGQQSALKALKQRRDAAMQAKKAKAYPPVTMHAAVASTPVAAKEQPIAHRERTPSSRLDTEEDLYGLSPGGEASRLRIEARRQSVQYPQSALKAQGTPAVEKSVLALTNFKRRPRQGSIIRMVQQTSELGDPEDHSDLDLEDDPILQGLENTLDDFDNFNPEKESTPLHLGKRKSEGGTNEPRTSSSRKRKHDEDQDEVQVPQSSPRLPSSPPMARNLSRSSTSTSLPEVVLSTQKSREVDVYSDTMAPPQSSSEPASPAKSPTRTDKRRKTAGRHDQEDESEDLPSPAQARKQKPRQKASTISTAVLQSLLPKPRRKPRAAKHADEYDIPSSDDDNDTLTLQDDDFDELAHSKSRRAKKTPMRKVSGNRHIASNSKKPTTATSPVSLRQKTPLAKAKVQEPEKPKMKKTYGRAAIEKENDQSIDIHSDHNSDDGDDTEIAARGKGRAGSVAPSKLSKTKELEQAKQKFAEVDEWEMEFESVDLGGGSSSPWR